MVLYNSPFAVALLLLGFLLASGGYLLHNARLLALAQRLEASDPSSRTSRGVGALRHYALLSLAQFIAVLLFAALLVGSVLHTIASPNTLAIPRRHVTLRLRTRRLESFDRFEIYGSASAAEQYRLSQPYFQAHQSLQPAP